MASNLDVQSAFQRCAKASRTELKPDIAWLASALFEACPRDYESELIRLAFDEFAVARARGGVARRIALLRKLADACEPRRAHVASAICGPLVSCMRNGCQAAAMQHARALLRADVPGVDVQKLVWLVLVEYPGVIAVGGSSSDLTALRILPNHLGGTPVSRAALQAHMDALYAAWLSSEDDAEFLRTHASSPLTRVEGGYFFFHLLAHRTTPPVCAATRALIAQCTPRPAAFTL